MKRARMDGPGFGMGGPGMGAPFGMHGGPAGGMNPPPGMMGGPGPEGFMGGPGPEQYGVIGRAEFPCVKLRGLPFEVNDDDVRQFLGVEPIDIVLMKRDGRFTGEAMVVLSGPMHVELALSKNRSFMGRRYIEVYKTRSKMDYYRAVVAEVTDTGAGYGGGRPAFGGRDDRFGVEGGGFMGGAPGGGEAFGQMGGRPAGGDGATAGTTILKLRGLPFSVSDDDICQWFNDDHSLGISAVVKDNVLVVMDHGRPSGIAFVEFPSPQEATQAMAKNKQIMGTRYIEIFPATRADLERASAAMAR